MREIMGPSNSRRPSQQVGTGKLAAWLVSAAWLLPGGALLSGCDTGPDTGPGSTVDGGVADGGASDSGSVGADAGSSDAGDGGGKADAVLPASKLVINEIAAMGGAVNNLPPTDWVELFNGDAADVDLAGWRIGDKLGEDKAKNFEEAGVLPPGTKVPAGGYLMIYFNHNAAGTPVVDKGLKSDEEVVIFNKSGAVIDHVDYNEGDSPEGGSFGRLPDGGTVFKTFSVPTPGKSNK